MTMALNRKEIRVTDAVFVAYAGCDHSGPYARVTGGEVVATGEDGSFAYRRADSGNIDSVPAYWVCTVHATEAEAWDANAQRLASIESQVAAKVRECQAKAMPGVLS
jgi:hypothetical protein